MALTYEQAGTAGTILCCLCGMNIPPNPANMCGNCIRTQVDITEGIQKACTVLWCKECNRWLHPPKAWVRAELESKELLTFCLKKIKGLNKVKLVDAVFLYTEPHSRRLKVKATIQKEVLNGAILQQTFMFVVEPHMCEQCQRSNTNSEVRQKVEHKRTFLFLEQLILKHGAEANAVGVKEAPDGLDFFYANRSHALKLVDFLGSVAAVRTRADKQLVGADHSSNTYNYKHTFCVEVAPVCKEDLVCLPHRVYSALGGLGPLLLCTRVSNTLTLLDVSTLRVAHVDASAYYRSPYRALLSARQLVEFTVLDVEPLEPSHGGSHGGAAAASAAAAPSSSAAAPAARYALADATVVRSSDLGRNNNALRTVRTHLGGHLRPGDTVLGYDLCGANLNEPELDAYGPQLAHRTPDAVLVRKSYAARRRARREAGGGGGGGGGAPAREWTLRRLAVDRGDETPAAAGPAAAAGPHAHAPPVRPGGAAAARRAAEEEEAFLEELEEDADLRARVALYRARHAASPGAAAAARRPAAGAGGGGDDDSDGVPEVPLEELLDELALGGGGGGEGGDDAMDG